MHPFSLGEKMKEQLQRLWRLQRIELSLIEAEREQEEQPGKIRLLEERLKAEEKKVEEAKRRLQEMERRRRLLERDLEEEKEKIRRSKLRLLEVKTNKEYEAILKEIEWSEQTNSSREEEILQILEEIDTLEAELPSLERSVEEEKGRISRQIEELKEKGEELERNIKAWLREKDEIMGTLPKDLLSLYEKLKERRGGLAVVLVKNEACQGCYVHIPPQLYNEVLKNNRLITCPNCQRILYWEEEKTEGSD